MRQCMKRRSPAAPHFAPAEHRRFPLGGAKALLVLAPFAVGLAACSNIPSITDTFSDLTSYASTSISTDSANSRSLIEEFSGAVVADEPLAAITGRNILSAGGSAADAAIAAYFAMAVTLPGTAGLGGGGTCLIHDPASERRDALVFIPLNYMAQMSASRGRARQDLAMVPGNPRGMFALHARYGRMRWPALLQPAITLARGHDVSRAAANQLAGAPARFRSDPAFLRIFGSNGRLLTEGQPLVQNELAGFLSLLSAEDPVNLYDGDLANQFAAAAQRMGISMTVADLSGFAPEFLPPVVVELGSNDLLFVPPPGDGSVLAAEQYAFLHADRRYARADAATRAHLSAEAQLISLAGLQDWVRNLTPTTSPEELVAPAALQTMARRYNSSRHDPPTDILSRSSLDVDHGSSGLVVVDRTGAAVACSLSMNAPFGIGRFVPGTGILLGAPMADPGALATPTGVAIAINGVNQVLFFAAASGGGIGGVGALAQVIASVFDDGLSLEDAVAQGRVHAAYGRDDVLLYESRLGAAIADSLGGRGHQTVTVEKIGSVSAILCSDGLPRSPACEVVVDQRGDGIAAHTNRR